MAEDIPYVKPQFDPLSNPIAPTPEHGFFKSVERGAKHEIFDAVKGVSWASDKIGVHWLDSTAKQMDITQQAEGIEQYNLAGHFVGESALFLSTFALDPAVGLVTPFISSTRGIRAISKGIEAIKEASPLVEKISSGTIKTIGLIKPVVTQTAGMVPFEIGASVSLDKNGVATLHNEEFAKKLAMDAAFIGTLHTVGKGVQVAWALRSPIDDAGKSLPKEDFVSTKTGDINEVPVDKSPSVKPDGTTKIEQKINDEPAPDVLTKDQKEATRRYIEDDVDTAEVAFSVRPHPDIADDINSARSRAASSKKSVSKPYADYIQALYSRDGIILNGKHMSIDDPVAIQILKGGIDSFKEFNRLRGARKVFMSEELNSRLIALTKSNKNLSLKLREVIDKYTRPMAMQNAGAIESKAKFRVDENTGGIAVDHPVWWLEHKGNDLDVADEKFLDSIDDKSARWFRAIINESARSHNLNFTENLLKEVSRSVKNFKDPLEQERIFQSHRNGFTEYGLSADDMDFSETVGAYEKHMAKSKDPDSKFYHKLISTLRDEGKADPFFKYLKCMIGAA